MLLLFVLLRLAALTPLALAQPQRATFDSYKGNEVFKDTIPVVIATAGAGSQEIGNDIVPKDGGTIDCGGEDELCTVTLVKAYKRKTDTEAAKVATDAFVIRQSTSSGGVRLSMAMNNLNVEIYNDISSRTRAATEMETVAEEPSDLATEEVIMEPENFATPAYVFDYEVTFTDSTSREWLLRFTVIPRTAKTQNKKIFFCDVAQPQKLGTSKVSHSLFPLWYPSFH